MYLKFIKISKLLVDKTQLKLTYIIRLKKISIKLNCLFWYDSP
jgi:hypothetical protein